MGDLNLLLYLLLGLIILGVVLYLINTYLPMDPKIKTIVNVLVVIIAIIWALSQFLPLAGLGR